MSPRIRLVPVLAALAALTLGVSGCAVGFVSGLFDDSTAAHDLRVGQCFNDPDGVSDEEVVEIMDVDVVDCSEPHDNEIYLTKDLTGSYPGDAAIEQLAFDECLAGFDAFVGTAYEDSVLDVFPMWPTSESWRLGDRGVICAVYDMDGAELTGTMAGSRR